MKTITQNIQAVEFLREIENGNVAIPAIQRDFVWPSDNIRTFIQGLINGFPFGAIYVAKIKSNFRTKVPKYYNVLFPNTKIENSKQIIIDGQQRLIALKLALSNSSIQTSTGKTDYIVLSNNTVVKRKIKSPGKNIRQLEESDFRDVVIPVIYIESSESEIYKLYSNINTQITAHSGWDLYIAKLTALNSDDIKPIIDELSVIEQKYKHVIKNISSKMYNEYKNDLILDKNGKVDNFLISHPNRLSKKITRLSLLLSIFSNLFREYRLLDDDFINENSIGTQISEYIFQNYRVNKDPITSESIINASKLSYLIFLKYYINNINTDSEDALLALEEKELHAILGKYRSLKGYKSPLVTLLFSYVSKLKIPDLLPSEESENVEYLNQLNIDDIQLEHIFPQKKLKIMSNIDQKTYSANIDRLGNYTFISKRTNIILSNADPGIKLLQIKKMWNSDDDYRKVASAHFGRVDILNKFTEWTSSFPEAINDREAWLLMVLARYLYNKKLKAK